MFPAVASHHFRPLTVITSRQRPLKTDSKPLTSLSSKPLTSHRPLNRNSSKNIFDKMLAMLVFASWFISFATSAPLLPQHVCQYKPASLSLSCTCSRPSLTVNSISQLLSEWPERPVEGLAISNCSSLDLNISTTNLTHPLLQITVDSIDYLTVRGIEVNPASTLDLHMSGVRLQANILGDIVCRGCRENSTLPGITVQVTDSPLLMLQSLTVGTVVLRMKTRNVAHVKVSQSDLGSMKGDSFEVFYTSKFEIRDSVFTNVESGEEVLVLNHVHDFLLDHVVGLSNTSYSLLSNDTTMTVYCSPVPLAPWDVSVCGPPPFIEPHTEAKPEFWAR
jgi:hypothetical protein